MKLFLKLQRRGHNVMTLVSRQESSCLRWGLLSVDALTCGSNLPSWLQHLFPSSVSRVRSALWDIHLAHTSSQVRCLHDSLAVLIRTRTIPTRAVDFIEVLYHLQIKSPLPVLRKSGHGLRAETPVVVGPLSSSSPHVWRGRLYVHARGIPCMFRRPLSI